MKISQLHSQDEFEHYPEACSPCEMSSHSPATNYWPEMCMIRRHVEGEPAERLSVCIRNPWPGLILQDVQIMFLTATPNTCQDNGQDSVRLAPSRSISFGDIGYAGRKNVPGTVRDIILLDNMPQERNRQFFAGVCFNAIYADGRQALRHGYVLFRSGCLPKMSY